MTTNRIPTLAEVLENAISTRLSDTYHVLPGIVQAYYPATQTADIQIAVNDPRTDPDSDVITTEQWPIYPQVRVVWPRFNGFTIIGPLAQGNPVQLFFQDLDDSNFRQTGQVGDPNRTLRHGSDAAFCVPWDMTDAGVATDAAAAANAMIIGKDGAQTEIRINGTTIQLGATGGDFVALASKVMSALNALTTAVNNHGHEYIPGTGAGAITSPASSAIGTGTIGPMPTPTNVGSALIAAQ